MASIAETIARRRSFYTTKLHSYEEWCCKKAEMNDTSLKYIRKMLIQMLKELGIPSTSANSILNAIYGSDYDASRLINRIIEQRNGMIFDILNKDFTIRQNSASAALYAINHMKICTAAYNPIQLTGLCVFVQFILISGRSELEGFGAVVDYVSKWKRDERKEKMKENQRIMDEQRKQADEAQKRALRLAEEEEEMEKKRLEEENIKLQPEEIVDSWEDL